jgi:hypothetical protein
MAGKGKPFVLGKSGNPIGRPMGAKANKKDRFGMILHTPSNAIFQTPSNAFKRKAAFAASRA